MGQHKGVRLAISCYLEGFIQPALRSIEITRSILDQLLKTHK